MVVPASFPVFFEPYDFGFMTGAEAAIIGTVTTAVPGIGGGAVIITGAGNISTPLNTGFGMFGWSFENIVPPGFSGTSPLIACPQRVGPRFAYFPIDHGGTPFLT